MTTNNNNNYAPVNHSVLLGSTSGGMNSLGTGLAGQVLTSNGGGVDPSWQSAPPGQLVLINTLAATNSASLNFTSIGSYHTYMLTWSGVYPAVNSANFYMRVSTDNGSTWKTSGYGSTVFSARGTSSSANYSDGFNIGWLIPNSAANQSTSNGTLWLYNANDSSYFYCAGTYGADNTTTSFTNGTIGGVATYNNVNAIQVLMNSGNFASKKISLYGLSQ